MEQGYNYIDPKLTLQIMTDFFKSRCENLEEKPKGKKSKKEKKTSKKHKSVQFEEDYEEDSSKDEKQQKVPQLPCAV